MRLNTGDYVVYNGDAFGGKKIGCIISSRLDSEYDYDTGYVFLFQGYTIAVDGAELKVPGYLLSKPTPLETLILLSKDSDEE